MTSMADLGGPEFISVDGLRIRYLRSTSGAGVPVLLLSPYPESLYAYEGVWADLAVAAPLIAVDLPGFGQSEGRPELYTSEAMAAFVTKLIPALGLERVHAVGPDVGTSALLFAASQRPDLFASVIVGDGGTDVEHTGSRLKDIVLDRLPPEASAADGPAAVEGLLRALTQTPPSAFVLEDYRASYVGSRYVDARAYLRAYVTNLPRLQALLPSISTPVLSIWGAKDPLVLPSSAEVLDRALPHTRSLELDAGHFAWHDRPKEYAAAVLDWISGGYRSA